MSLPDSFLCEDSIRPHLRKIFEGEYAIPLSGPVSAILDIGANSGAFAIWSLGVWPAATVHCYEPHPKTFRMLLRNIEVCRPGSTVLYNHAIGSPGIRPLYNGSNNSGEATLFADNQASNGTGQFVEVMSPLTLPKADILKVDAEGSEVEIIAPLIACGHEFSAIMFEYHRVSDRRVLDGILIDYILTGASVSEHPAIGVCRYIHRKHYERMNLCAF